MADVYLTQFFHSDSIVATPTGVTNFSHCDVADDAITEARSESDPERQQELWATAQSQIMSPWLPADRNQRAGSMAD